MKAQRPYLLRALHQWLLDSDEIPYVLIDAQMDGVQVPEEHVQDGQIVLNIGPSAVRDLVLGDEYVMCSSRFSGRVFELVLPLGSVRAIYGKESGQGMVFPEEALYQGSLNSAGLEPADAAAQSIDPAQESEAPPEGSGRPTLKLV